jgi:hypothetical protein
VAAIVFQRKGKKVRFSWPDADAVLDVLKQLGADEPGNWLGGDEIPDDEAKKVHDLLDRAMRAKKIGIQESSTDPVGRDLAEPMEVLAVGGSKPLDDYWREKLIEVLDLLA